MAHGHISLVVSWTCMTIDGKQKLRCLFKINYFFESAQRPWGPKALGPYGRPVDPRTSPQDRMAARGLP